MKKVHLCVALLLLVIMGTSCTKEKNLFERRVDMLVDKDWIQTAFLADNDGDGNPETNVFGFMSECDKDDLTFFDASGSYQQKEGFSKCQETDPDVITEGSWVLEEDASTLKMTDGAILILNATISELSNTEMRYTFTEGNSTFTATFKSRR
ncbi:MAG: lipocalin family protein [Bacteroidota bacterium]